MMKSWMRAILYLPLLVLLVLLFWAYSTAQTWQDIAAAADKTGARAAIVAKEAVQRADRCVSELYKTKPPEKTAGKAQPLPGAKKKP